MITAANFRLRARIMEAATPLGFLVMKLAIKHVEPHNLIMTVSVQVVA